MIGPVIPAELRVVAEKLKRFEGSDSDGCDISRDWFDVLTTIGLLRRVQRSPALWEMTEAGQSLVDLIDSHAATAAPDIEQPRDPVIPVDKWPDDAAALLFKASGQGSFLRSVEFRGAAFWYIDPAQARMPPGHDWRVPVMRHQPSPAVSQTTATLIDLLISRDQAGRAKYGETLDRTDLTRDEWLQHLAEELLDGAGYALAAKRTAATPAAP